MTLKLDKLKKIFFAIVLLELFLGGSGRMLEIGDLTIRMYFFIGGLILSLVILFYKGTIHAYVVYVILTSIIIIAFSSITGFLNGAPVSLILLDIKPMAFILFLLIAYLFIDTKEDVYFVANLLMYSGVLLAILYLSTLYLLYFNYIDFNWFWHKTYDYHEFFFRGTSGFFTYKGFIYIGISFIFWERLTENKFKKNILLAFISTAILFTGTRGYIVALALIYFIYLIIPKMLRGQIKYLLIMLFAALLMIYFVSNNDLGDKAFSDSQRITQLSEVINSINYQSFIWGHGFGIGVPSKPIHMEIAFLEIFHKQGFIGIIFWFSIITYILFLYLNLNLNRRLAQPFVLSTFFVFVLSVTNPYINNPIGLTLILTTIVVLNTLRKIDQDENIRVHGYI